MCAKDDKSDKDMFCWEFLVIHFDNKAIFSYDHAKVAVYIFQSR